MVNSDLVKSAPIRSDLDLVLCCEIEAGHGGSGALHGPVFFQYFSCVMILPCLLPYFSKHGSVWILINFMVLSSVLPVYVRT